MKKTTEELLNQINETTDIKAFLTDNSSEFLEKNLTELLNDYLAESNLSIAQIAVASAQGDYIYKVFQGKRKASRDVILSISIGMQLSIEKTQTLLRSADIALLDPRKQKDSIIIYAINHHLSIMQLNDILYDVLQITL